MSNRVHSGQFSLVFQQKIVPVKTADTEWMWVVIKALFLESFLNVILKMLHHKLNPTRLHGTSETSETGLTLKSCP